jgi:hypothetical protein
MRRAHGQGRRLHQSSSAAPDVVQAKEALRGWSLKRSESSWTAIIKKRPFESVSLGFVLGILAGSSRSKPGSFEKILTNMALKEVIKRILKH